MSNGNGTNYRWTKVPIELFELLEKGTITPTDMTLLLRIHSLTNPGKPCFASNANLAKTIGKDRRYVSGLISRLRRLGLLFISGGNLGDRRFIDTKWSRASSKINDSENENPPDSSVGGPDTPGGGPDSSVRGVPIVLDPPPDRSHSLLTKTKLLRKQIQSRPAERDGEGVKMPFDESLEPTLPNDVDTRRAIKLKEALKAKDLIRTRVNVKQWAKQFRLLRQDVGKGVIKPVLQWHCDHAGERGVPQAWSASSFRKKFDQIRNSMTRQFVKSNTPTVHKDHDKTTKSIYEELKGRNWPKGSKTQLLDAIQDSVTEYEPWRKSLFKPDLLTKVKQCDTKVSRDRGRINGRQLEKLLVHLQDVTPGASTFIRNWFDDINKSVQNWDAWSGNLRSMGVLIGHKKFQDKGRGWTNDYCGDPERWDKLMELMK